MGFLRISLHSFVLSLVNIGSIIIGVGVYHLLKPNNQILTIFALWSLFIHNLHFKYISLQCSSELVLTYLAAFVWAPIIFVPLHFITQGYLTSIGNVIAIWLFQLPTNFLTILIANREYSLFQQTLAVFTTFVTNFSNPPVG